MDDLLKSLTKFGCMMFFLLIFAGGSFFIYLQLKKPTAIEKHPKAAESKAVGVQDIDVENVSKPRARTWTDVDGREIDGFLISATQTDALVRVIPADRVYRIPRAKLSQKDQAVLDEWIEGNPDGLPYPAVSSQWPNIVDGRTRDVPIQEAGEGKDYVWKTANYEIHSPSEVEEGTVESLGMICESIEGAIRSVPLPLTWGRPTTKKREIFLYPTRREYLETGAQPNWGGHFQPKTNQVHLVTEFLEDVDLRSFFGQYTLKKRNQYDLLVHEIVHQATLSIIAAQTPAWGTEGIAEYFAAMQNPPGRFRFNESQIAVRRHITDSLQFDGLIEVKSLPMPRLREFLYKSTPEFNIDTGDARDGGFCYYAAALVLVEYFCHGDGNSMRPFLEAVVTGADPASAVDTHLLRGRTPSEIETALSERWRSKGLALEFVSSPTLRLSNLEGGVGINSSLSNFRRGL